VSVPEFAFVRVDLLELHVTYVLLDTPGSTVINVRLE
jgi:hypothetical protein